MDRDPFYMDKNRNRVTVRDIFLGLHQESRVAVCSGAAKGHVAKGSADGYSDGNEEFC